MLSHADLSVGHPTLGGFSNRAYAIATLPSQAPRIDARSAVVAHRATFR